MIWPQENTTQRVQIQWNNLHAPGVTTRVNDCHKSVFKRTVFKTYVSCIIHVPVGLTVLYCCVLLLIHSSRRLLVLCQSPGFKTYSGQTTFRGQLNVSWCRAEHSCLQRASESESDNVYSVYLQWGKSDFINMHCSANIKYRRIGCNGIY